MKIACLSSSTIPSLAANSVQVMKMCAALAAAGHEVELYARQGSSLMSTDEIRQHYAITQSFKIHLLSAPHGWAVGGAVYGLKVANALKNSSFKPDLLYGRNIYALLACSSFGIDMIYEAHAAPYNPGRRFLEKVLFSRAVFKRLVTINSALRDFYLKNYGCLRKSGGPDVIVAHDGATSATSDVSGDKHSGVFKIGYAGGLYPGKGMEMITALAGLLGDCEFHVAGGTAAEVEFWRARCSGNNVIFHGHLRHADVSSFLAECNVLLAPYQRRVTTNRQGIGNIADWMSPLKLFEYMACRRAIVASRLPAVGEILVHDKTALLVDSDNCSAWCDAIKRLRDSGNLRNFLADQAFSDFSSNYTWLSRARSIIRGFSQAEKPFTGVATDKKPVRCLHVINDLDIGGAENALYKLVSLSDRANFSHMVVSLLPPGELKNRIIQAGAKVASLGMTRNRLNIASWLRLARLIKQTRPDLMHTWMYYSDIVGGLTAFFSGSIPVIFSIRHGSFSGDKLKTIISARVAALLSHFIPSRIVACSHAASLNHRRIGYAIDRLQIIPNGFSQAFALHQQHESLRNYLGIPADRPLIGMVGRFVPAKDHLNFIAAAAIVKKAFPGVEFLLCGAGISVNNSELLKMLDACNLRSCFHLLNSQNEVSWIIKDLTFLVSSSISEAFANVIGEAMVCGVPCVVTNVGDSAHIVGDTGIIVPPGNCVALAGGMIQMLDMTDSERVLAGNKARERVLKEFNLVEIVKGYENLYLEVLDGRQQNG